MVPVTGKRTLPAMVAISAIPRAPSMSLILRRKEFVPKRKEFFSEFLLLVEVL